MDNTVSIFMPTVICLDFSSRDSEVQLAKKSIATGREILTIILLVTHRGIFRTVYPTRAIKVNGETRTDVLSEEWLPSHHVLR